MPHSPHTYDTRYHLRIPPLLKILALFFFNLFLLLADFEPPSFSLGLNFDFDLHPQTTVRTNSSLREQSRPSSSNQSFCLIEDDDDFEAPTLGGDPQVSEPPRTFKRLQRGIAFDSALAAQNRELVEVGCNLDDDIEEFSLSQEDRLGGEVLAAFVLSL
ncbi:hypothetical protein U1Q18_004835 [Sarracenia purpurea var. burkii]